MSEVDLTSDEVKQAISDAVAEEVKGLKAKNAELIQKLEKARKGQEIDPADLAAVEAERDDLKGKLSEATQALTKATKDAEAAAKKAAEIDSAYSKSIADAALTETLAKAGVTNPVHLKAAKALLAGGVQVADDNGQRVVKAGDKALGDYITEWAGSDEGKHFVTNNANGGSSHGGRGSPDQQPKRGSMTAAEKHEFIGKHGQEAYLKLPKE